MARSRGGIREAPPKYDAYFGMLMISLLASITALIFLFLDYSSYPSSKPAQVPKASTTFQSAEPKGT